MESIIALTKRHPQLTTQVGIALKIENAPYMALCVESIGEGPRGLPALSVAHYGLQNGDLMRDPEMCFEMEIEDGFVKELHPYHYRNDYADFEQTAVIFDGEDPDHKRLYRTDLQMMKGQREFAQTWDRNIVTQGFLLVTDYSVKL
jgi:hypothetical protein